MQDMAEMIVEQARMMPTEKGVALTCNGARIAKVAVVGGFGLEVTSADKERRLVFPLNEKTSQGVQMAAESFLSEGHHAVEDVHAHERYHPTVRHENGLRLLTFEWNTRRELGIVYAVCRLLLEPPVDPTVL
jgi:hypothetical protein